MRAQFDLLQMTSDFETYYLLVLHMAAKSNMYLLHESKTRPTKGSIFDTKNGCHLLLKWGDQKPLGTNNTFAASIAY